MEVKIARRFELPVGAEQAWALLSDVRATAACMPGAQLTEQLDERRYKGLMRSRIGPAELRFAGELEVLETDAAARSLRMRGKGGDTNGSSATMDLRAAIEAGERAGSSWLVGETVVAASGRVAQFGGRLMEPVADSLLGSFVRNFAVKAGEMPALDDASPASVSAPAPAAMPAAPPLSVFALAWSSFRRWLALRFSPRQP